MSSSATSETVARRRRQRGPVLTTPAALTEANVRDMLAALLDAHGMLRARLRSGTDGWRLTIPDHGPDPATILTRATAELDEHTVAAATAQAASRLSPADGVMMLHTIVKPDDEEFTARNLPVTMTKIRFFKFIMDEIFPGGDLPQPVKVKTHATKAGFGVGLVQPLRLHYARTLDLWAAALEANKDQAIAIQSDEVYERYMKYLTGCADLFRDGYTDICQFTLTKG